MNSPAEPFDGVFPAGMALPVVYSLLVVGLLGQAIPRVIQGITSPDQMMISDPTNPSTMNLGRNYPAEDEIGHQILELFGLPRDFGGGFFSSIMAGLMMFYGLDAPITPFSSFTTDFIKSLINVIFAPGYYLIITKGILRDTASIVNAFTNFQNDILFELIYKILVDFLECIGSNILLVDFF